MQTASLPCRSRIKKEEWVEEFENTVLSKGRELSRLTLLDARKELASNAADPLFRRLSVQHVMFADKRRKAMPSGIEDSGGEVVVESVCGKGDEEDACRRKHISNWYTRKETLDY
mmetsp:Transcript_21531/g.32732  ORF Transcript_21531/g.32732 Transcript_21531/m.32732 type:complete len:115 (+) Transcript_21531:1914-2258(+)